MLLHEGCILSDDAALDSLIDAQLVSLSFQDSSEPDKRKLLDAVAGGDVPVSSNVRNFDWR